MFSELIYSPEYAVLYKMKPGMKLKYYKFNIIIQFIKLFLKEKNNSSNEV